MGVVVLIYGIRYEDKIIYVGQTIRTFKQRLSSYKYAIKDKNVKTYIINHLRYHGYDNHIFFVIEDNISSQLELNNREIFYIKHHNTLFPNGLNLTEGGISSVFSEETRQKMSKAKIGKVTWNKGTKGLMAEPWNKGKKGTMKHTEESKKKLTKFGEQNHFFGKKHSEGSINKMSQSLKGRKVWNEVKNRIIKLDKKLNIIKIYDNKKFLVDEGFEISSLNRAIRTNITYKGFYFKVEK